MPLKGQRTGKNKNLPPGVKYCKPCDSIKPLSEFHADKNKADGRMPICRPCRQAKRNKHGLALTHGRELKPSSYYKQRYERRIRFQVLENYGGKCACCGESEFLFLCIDHVNNDGAEHRREIRTSIYTWLLKNRCPKDRFQVLCFNCNMAKSFYGVCPHGKGS